MTNRKKYWEYRKKLWIIKDKTGKILDTYRTKVVAYKYKRILEKQLMEDLTVERLSLL